MKDWFFHRVIVIDVFLLTIALAFIYHVSIVATSVGEVRSPDPLLIKTLWALGTITFVLVGSIIAFLLRIIFKQLNEYKDSYERYFKEQIQTQMDEVTHKATSELKDKFNDAMVGWDKRIRDIKKEINKLERKISEHDD